MEPIKFYFHPLFFIFSFFLIYFGKLSLLSIYFIVLIMHEFAHLIVARMLGYKINSMVFMPYGLGLNAKNIHFEKKHEVVIALAGPILNITIAIVTIAIWWFFPISYAFTKEFVLANLSLGIFNLLPIFPLDGGRIVGAYAKHKKKVRLVLNIICIASSIVFLSLFIYSFFKTPNFTYLFVATFLLCSIYTKSTDEYYKIFRKYDDSPKEIKTIRVKKGTTCIELVKFIKPDCYTEFIVYDENNHKINSLSEIDILEAINKNKNK